MITWQMDLIIKNVDWLSKKTFKYNIISLTVEKSRDVIIKS